MFYVLSTELSTLFASSQCYQGQFSVRNTRALKDQRVGPESQDRSPSSLTSKSVPFSTIDVFFCVCVCVCVFSH